MKLPGYSILKEVTKKRVITLGEARKFFTTHFDDKRDFFALASLYTGGKRESYVSQPNPVSGRKPKADIAEKAAIEHDKAQPGVSRNMTRR